MEKNSLSNLWDNLSGKKKLGVVVSALLALSFLVVLVAMFAVGSNVQGGPEGMINGTYQDEQGNIVNVETTVNENGETVTTRTKTDEYGNTTTVDPNLITTYFPYQVMREHAEWTPTLKYYLYISDDNNMVINAMIEACDEERDMALVQQYIDSIPLDMSGYTVEYQTFDTDADCGD